MIFFSDPLHDDFASLALGFAPYGGSDFGEIQAVALEVKEGDDGSFHDSFVKLAHRRIEEGDAAAAKGHRVSAHDCYLRAVCFLGVAYHPLYGTPVDPRLVDTFHLEMNTFDRAMEMLDPPGEKLDIPYENTTMPGYFLRAPGHANEVRPVVVVGGGWDSTYDLNHVGIGVAALRRGYHVLLHDGPGQGRPLIDEGLPLRHDWEKVVTPVVDAALAIDVVDPDRIVYHAWSLGGYMAPRAAAYEHRLGAIVADPGQLDVGVKFFGIMKMFGLDDAAVARLPALDPDDEKKALDAIESNRSLRWKILQRGYWTNAATDLSSYLVEMAKWKLEPDEVAAIQCPTLITAAESDPVSSNAKALYDGLTCPKTFIEFQDADGAGAHCEALNRSMANRVIIDWLDETLNVHG
ncbi:MAG TPA: alpha/beta fold hydrolase [Acidimicrobiales bacterium]|nr:alpha/beta fold hydrolase [Acidimicrobiales bacterium]